MYITKRHYDLVIKQAKDNYPEECGGFLGGLDDTIKAVYPIFNQHLYNKTDTFAITSEDIARAHAFFEKHGLRYFGVYHTHPKATADPSAQDLSHIQRYMFIISLLDLNHPDFAAYVVNGRAYNRIPLHIINHQDVVDIHAPGPKKDTSIPPSKATATTTSPNQDYLSQIKDLDDQLNQVLRSPDSSAHFPKNEGNGIDSDFWTMA